MRVLILVLGVLCGGGLWGQAECDCPYPIVFMHGWSGAGTSWDNVYTSSLLTDIYGTFNPNTQVYHAMLNATPSTDIFSDGIADYPAGIYVESNAPYSNDDVIVHEQFVNTNRLDGSACLFAINFSNYWNFNPSAPLVLTYDNSKIGANHSASNQSSALKQGYAFGKAIRAIIEATGKEKVVVVAHSMGGLAAREYLQRTEIVENQTRPRWWAFPEETDTGHRIAKLLTVGTPHGGSNSGDWFNGVANLGTFDLTSEAVRDLRTDHSNVLLPGSVPGGYLFGSPEESVRFFEEQGAAGFDNYDINCDGIVSSEGALGINGFAPGLVDNGLMPLPVDGIKYSYYVSAGCLGLLPSDGIVFSKNQWLYSGGTGSMTDYILENSTPAPYRISSHLQSDRYTAPNNVVHTSALQELCGFVDEYQTNDIQLVTQGMDEGDFPEFAYLISGFDKTQIGLAQVRADFVASNSNRFGLNGSNNDRFVDGDWYRFELSERVDDIHIEFNPVGGIPARVDLYLPGEILSFSNNDGFFNATTVDDVVSINTCEGPSGNNPGTYYVRITHDLQAASDPFSVWRTPYKFKVTPINYELLNVSSICVGNGSLNLSIDYQGQANTAYAVRLLDAANQEVNTGTFQSDANGLAQIVFDLFDNTNHQYTLEIQGGNLACTVNEVISSNLFPINSPTPAPTDCSQLTFTYDGSGSLQEYTVSDNFGNTQPLSENSQPFVGRYVDGDQVTITISDPSGNCSQVIYDQIIDCSVDTPDPCQTVSLTAGTVNCDTETVNLSVSGEAGRSYTITQAGGNSINVSAAFSGPVAFVDDGSGQISFTIADNTQPTVACGAPTVVNLSVCDQTPTDHSDYEFYWPFEDGTVANPSPWRLQLGSDAHQGADINAEDWNLNTGGDSDCGEPVYAPLAGEILIAGTGAASQYGRQIVIRSNQYPGVGVRLAHLETIAPGIVPGPIEAGTFLGTVGKTGLPMTDPPTFFCHLHVAFYQNLDDAAWATLTTGGLPSNEDFSLATSFNAVGKVSVQSFVTAGQCFAPGEAITIDLIEEGTARELVVEICDASGNNCAVLPGGNTFVLDPTQNTALRPFNTTLPSTPGMYTIKAYDPIDPASTVGLSANAFEIANDCGMVAPTCGAPSALNIVSDDSGENITVSWPAVNGAMGYRVEGKLTTDNDWTLFATNFQNTSFTGPVAACTGYEFRVATRCVSSSFSDFVSNSIVTDGCGGGPTGPDGPVTGSGSTGGNTDVGDCDGDNEDDEDPVFINCPPQNYVFGIDNADACEAYVNWSVPVAIDNCNVDVTQTSGPQPGDLLAAGTYAVVYVAEDNNDNTETCAFTIRVEDPQTLQFTNCPTETLTFGTNPDLCSVRANWSIPVAVDNCNVTVSHVSGPQPGDELAPGIYQVVYEATNNGVGDALETATCSFFVQVIETQNPEINCPQDVFVESDPGVCEAAVENIQLEFAVDNCPFTVTWTSSPTDVTGTGTSTSDNASGAIFPVGITTVTYTIMENDDNGNGIAVASCDLIVEVTDTEAPEITCPQSVTIGTDDDGAGNYDCATDYTWNHPTPTDNCAVTVYELTYTNPDGSVEGPLDWGADAGATVSRNFALGVTTILYQVEDAEGNVTTCEWAVEVIDDEDPMIFCEENFATNVFNFSGELDILPRDTVVAVLNVPVSATISEVNIPALSGGHPDMGDVAITLTSPAGTTITLFDGLCSGTTNFELALDNTSASSVNTAPCNSLGGGGAFAPADALAAFNGENSQGDWTLTITSQLAGACGSLDTWNLEIIGNDNTQPPVNRLQVVADAGTCAYFLTGKDFDPRFIDNCEGAFITHDYLSGPFDTTLMGSTFPIGETEILWTVTDAAGNTATCPMIVEVLDNEAPRFTNCARPDIIANPTPGVCDAFVNFSLPLATDNCGDAAVTINQIDGTGLTTGMRFPVGTTILMYEALDPAGNRSDCEFRVIVNDNQGVTASAGDGCPDNVETTTDAGDCVAVVSGLAPAFADNCGDNLSYIYKIEDAAGVEIASGFTDASGEAFPLGTNTVTYRAQDQALLLITEVTHEIQEVLGGNDVIPSYVGFRGLPDGDYLELTNFGTARLDIGGLDIERITAMGIDHFRVPALEILEPGETFVLQFGNDDISPADHYYVINCATDLTSTDAAAYIISHSGRVLDVAALNGFDPVGQGNAATVTAADWSGAIFDDLAGIRRASVYDDNLAEDFVAASVCGEITIGTYNPDFIAVPNNGSLTANQARIPNSLECTFTVTVTDEELPECGSYASYDDFEFGQATTISPGDCFEAILNVTDAYLLADVNTSLIGTAGSFGNLRITLISPEGQEVLLADNECAAEPGFDLVLDSDSITRPFIYEECTAINSALHLRPRQDLNHFHNRPSAGAWTLRIAHDATEDTEDVMLESWTLSLSQLLPYAQTDETIENDFRECGADFTWLHTGVWDNCPGGTVAVTYFFKDTIQDSYAIPRNRFGRDTTRFFDVGVTTVEYTLTDVNGNVNTCSFDLSVLDTEPPVLVCPADTTLFLEGGECDIVYTPVDWSVTDNCVIRDTMTSPDWNLPLPIGVNPVDLTVTDTSGNATVCTYVVTVIEYDPPNPQMACIGDLNVSLDQDCSVDIVASMLLAGNEYYCFDNYEVILLQRNEEGVYDTLPEPMVGIEQIGDTLIYNVYDPRNDDLCWGYLQVGFYDDPAFICPADTEIECNGSFDPSLNGEPVLLSCALAGATVSYADTLERFEACDDPRAIMRRTWLVEDAYGNSASCVQTITMNAFDLDQVVFPADLDGETAAALSCFDVANDPTLTAPENTGYPTVAEGSNIFQTNFCSASFLYTDEVYDICAGSFEIVRTWKVRSTCGAVIAGENPRVATQVIRVLDQENPALVCPEDETISTGGFGCFGEYLIPVPVVEESCSDYTYEVSVSGGTLSNINGNYVLTELEVGTISIRYFVEDECGRFSECIYYLTVTDQYSANASCKDQLNVSLDNNGTATVMPEDVDAGSTDFCSAINFRVRREINMDPASCIATDLSLSEWGDFVTLNCCEVNQLVKVELEVTDENGNTSHCWTNVLVEDKVAPVCIPPNPVTVSCLNLTGIIPSDLNQAALDDPQGTYDLLDATFDVGGGVDNCLGSELTQSVTDNRNTCGVGTIIRRFTVTDAQGLQPLTACTQTITVAEVHDYYVKFPGDRSSNECMIPEYDNIEVVANGCDLIVANTVVDTFEATGSECYKLRITHEVINWCEYREESGLYQIPRDPDNDQDFEEPFFLHLLSQEEEVITDDLALLSSAENTLTANLIAFLDERDEGTVGYPATLSGLSQGIDPQEPYGTDPARGGFRYYQYIKVFDEVGPTITVEAPTNCFEGINPDCSATFSLNFEAMDDCGQVLPLVELEENYVVSNGFTPDYQLTAEELIDQGNGDFLITRDNVPPGEHAVRISVNDGCGNTNVRIIPFCVSPDKAPAPICIQTITVTVMPDGNGGGIADLWATDAIASDVQDCFGNTINQYSIYTEEEANTVGFSPASDRASISFDCTSDFRDVPTRIYAFDQLGQNDYCQIIVQVQPLTSSMCDPDAASGMINGTIATTVGDGVENVRVVLEGASGAREVNTNVQGQFQFNNVLHNLDYTVTPTHYHDYLNGVRTSDIVAITRHILGVNTFTENQQLIAADVDGNTEINVGDVIGIRRLILGLSDNFPNDMPSWQFIPRSYEFPESLNPWVETFPVVNNINNLATIVFDADFMACKLGDVDGSASPNGRSNPSQEQLNGALELVVPNLFLEPGKEYEVPVFATNLTEYSGFQTELTFSPLQGTLTAVIPANIGSGFFALDHSSNSVRISWDRGAISNAFDNSGLLLTLKVRSSTAGILMESLQHNNSSLVSEAYHTDLSRATMSLAFEEGPLSLDYQLLDNLPNPFTHQTSLRFQLPRPEPEVSISIHDVTGRLITTYVTEGIKGLNVFPLKAKALGASGVYSYTIMTNSWSATGKLVVDR